MRGVARAERRQTEPCRVYWGSHGCKKHRGHTGPHLCGCETPPYFGAATEFYGEDVDVGPSCRLSLREEVMPNARSIHGRTAE